MSFKSIADADAAFVLSDEQGDTVAIVFGDQEGRGRLAIGGTIVQDATGFSLDTTTIRLRVRAGIFTGLAEEALVTVDNIEYRVHKFNQPATDDAREDELVLVAT